AAEPKASDHDASPSSVGAYWRFIIAERQLESRARSARRPVGARAGLLELRAMAKRPRRRGAGAVRRALQRVSKGFRRLTKLLPSARTRRRSWRLFRATPWWLQLGTFTAATVAVWFPVNAAYQVVRKPSELFFPVSGALYKTPAETWDAYGRAFERLSTAVISPELLAALAQVEGSGNPVVRTYWRWSLTHEPFEIYRPASSAVGMYQITDGTFAEAR